MCCSYIESNRTSCPTVLVLTHFLSPGGFGGVTNSLVFASKTSPNVPPSTPGQPGSDLKGPRAADDSQSDPRTPKSGQRSDQEQPKGAQNRIWSGTLSAQDAILTPRGVRWGSTNLHFSHSGNIKWYKRGHGRDREGGQKWMDK